MFLKHSSEWGIEDVSGLYMETLRIRYLTWSEYRYTSSEKYLLTSASTGNMKESLVLKMLYILIDQYQYSMCAIVFCLTRQYHGEELGE